MKTSSGGDYTRHKSATEMQGTVQLATATGIKWVAKKWYKIKLEIDGGNIQAFIDGVKHIDYTLPDGAIFQSGKAGFYNLSTPDVFYKDFYLENSRDNKIHSTCKMVGHIGWEGRTEGIVSVISDGDRLKFWDSYTDKELGFLEFVKDTNAQDKQDGFIPENDKLFKILGDKFTAIDFLDGATYFVSSNILTSTRCTSFASKYGVNVVSIPLVPITLRDKIKQMTGGKNKCVLMDPTGSYGTFKEQQVSTRTKTVRNGNSEFVCSPLTCKDHSCQEASCLMNKLSPTGEPYEDYIGTKVELTPAELADYNNGILCLDQVCDAMKDYYPLCGRDTECPTEMSGIIETKNGECKEAYCTEGILIQEELKCRVERCPAGTTENPNGTCSKS